MRHFGDTTAGVFGAQCPITRSSRTNRARRSRKAACFPGESKATFGTVGHARGQYRHRSQARERYLSDGAVERDGVRSFCIEGMVNSAGAMIDWAVAELGIAPSAASCRASRRVRAGQRRRFRAAGAAGPGQRRTAMQRATPSIGGLTSRNDACTRRARRARRHRVSVARSARRDRDGDAADRRTARRRRRVAQRHADADSGRRARNAGRASGDRRCERARRRRLRRRGCGTLAGRHGAALRRIDRTFEPTLSADEPEGRFERWRNDCGIRS